MSRKKRIETLTHADASRKNIPTAEYQPVIPEGDRKPVHVAYERRNRDLDPQLVWRGKDAQDWSDLVVPAPPLFIQEKVHPKVLIDDLARRSRNQMSSGDEHPDLFADFNGLPEGNAKTEFYQHDTKWSNRMILGDSLQVMASLAERERLHGKVQCIYMDPPYGIKFNSNFQWSTTSRSVKDGKADHITREPEQVKAFRDTWRDGVHSYLTHMRDRLTVARDLLTESGSVFVQIGDENVHRIRALMDEVFGEENAMGLITFSRSAARGTGTKSLDSVADYIIWFARFKPAAKYRQLYRRITESADRSMQPFRYVTLPDTRRRPMRREEKENPRQLPADARRYRTILLSAQSPSVSASPGFSWQGNVFRPTVGRGWKTSEMGLHRLARAGRLQRVGRTLEYISYADQRPGVPYTNQWIDTAGTSDSKSYVVQTTIKVIERCILMTTDPSDLVLDPTCGSGTTAYVAEQWGRRWITIDTSRVALALARGRIMGARYPYYLLADSAAGMEKEAQLAPTSDARSASGDIRQGFVYRRVPRITLKAIANNTEIDEIWEAHQGSLEQLRMRINEARQRDWEDWEVPHDAEDPWNASDRRLFDRIEAEREKTADNGQRLNHLLRELNSSLGRSYTVASLPERPADPWPKDDAALHAKWWRRRIARQKEIDASIAANADYEYLYDKPYEDKRKVRVSGPFTVESLSPHREVGVDEYGDTVDSVAEKKLGYGPKHDFVGMVLDNLRTAGVQQAHKEDKVVFSSLSPWPGHLVCAEGRFIKEGSRSRTEKRAAVFVGPEFGTVTRPDLASAAREAAEAGFDILIACAFNYGPHATDFKQLGRIRVLKARMNADLHMAEDLSNTGKGNLFVVFGEPDVEIVPANDGNPDDDRIRVKIRGVDVFHPGSGEIRSHGADGIACWFIDTDYNEESFFVRHAYFLGTNDPYKSLKTTLRAEINLEAWATLKSDTSASFDRPSTGRIAVKVINHLGDEVMKVFRA